MDFVVSLPAFQGNTVIMVVVDRFSNPGHFGMSLAHFIACKVAKLSTTTIYKLHGYLKSVKSNINSYFFSKL